MQLNEQNMEVISSTAGKVTYIGASGAVFFGLTLNELGMVVGVIVAVLGFLVRWYYEHKTYKLREYEVMFKKKDSKDGVHSE